MLGIGLMSGTSADGIDAAAVEFSTAAGPLSIRMLASLSLPYPAAVRLRLFDCFEQRAGVREICLLHARIGELFADAAQQLRDQLPGTRLDFVASHGQTVWHEPNPAGEPAPPGLEGARGTLQLGDPARIAARLGVPVVSNFRQQDLAVGGQGAPLVPFVDQLLFGSATENLAIQNLGGIGNVTYLPAGGGPDAVLAFDTGPANAWIDAAAVLASGGTESCDRDGRLAAAAPPDPVLLQRLMAEPYLAVSPPKSTGRELFGAARVRRLWDEGCRGPALVSTLTQFTVESIALAYRRWLGPVSVVVLGGGGAHNPELRRRLAVALAPMAIRTHEEYGFDGDAKEALAFAVLGFETLHGRPSNVPSATGAARAVIQGEICRC
jgi:anhydro-N-acetylmuramic acid kinase